MKNIWSRVVTSSTDPTKVSLAVKGFLLMFAPFIIMATGITDTEYHGIVEVIERIVFFGMMLVGAVIGAYGLIRKALLRRWTHPDA